MRSERLVYEPLAMRHADGLVAALSDERVGTFIGGPDVTTVAAQQARIRILADGPSGRPDERWINIVALLPDPTGDESTIIGRLEATTYGDWAEIAYLFGPAWWGNGYATEGTAWLIEHLRSEHGIDECWAAVHPDNGASARLLDRLGFRRVDRPTRPMASCDEVDLVFTRTTR